MTTDEKIKAKREAKEKQEVLQALRALYKDSFYEFFKDAMKVLKPNVDWKLNFHHQLLCTTLQDEAYRIHNKEKKKHDYIINIPPGTTKSNLVSVCFQAWVWGCVNPHLSFLCLSNADDLTIDFATDTLDILQSPWYQELFPNIKLRIDSTAKSKFMNTYGGTRYSQGILSKVTGKHADFILIDDPQDAKDISPDLLNKAISNYENAVTSRLNDSDISLILIISQRLHENDLCGNLLSKNSEGAYKHICLPAELTDDVNPPHLKKFYRDGLLWPERLSLDTIIKKKNQSIQVYATQYLQQPAPLEGTVIQKDWFKTVDSAPAGIEYHLWIDSALTDNKNNDPSAILVAGVKDNIIYVKDIQEVYLRFPDLIKKIVETVELHSNANCKIYIEPKANGISIVDQLKRESLLNVIPLKATNEKKEIRVNAITPKLESGRVVLVKGGWNQKFLHQAATFPDAKHDDMVDCLAYCVSTLLGTGTGKIRMLFTR